MKKINLLFLLLAPLISNAKPMSSSDAEFVVSNWLTLDNEPLKSEMNSSIWDTQSYYNENGETIYHIVSLNPTGYVIVSADDLIEPIIGFIPDGRYDPNKQDSIANFLVPDMSIRTRNAREKTLKNLNKRSLTKAPNTTKWNSLMTSNRTRSATGRDKSVISDIRVSPIAKTSWSQKQVDGQNYYNYFTPNNYPSGCVITAQAQLMKYHEHPKTDIGTRRYSIRVDGAYQYGNLMGGDNAGGPYQWQDMDNTPLLNGFEETSAKAVGGLMHDIGLTLNAQYGESVTGAYSRVVASSLKSAYSYSNAIAYNSEFSGRQNLINKMFNTNIDAGYPTLFAVRDDGGGHMIMVDGYGYQLNTMYHHLNMGWGGWEDGWYNLPNVDSSPGPYWKMTTSIYNVFPTGSGEIISGRILSKDNKPIVGANVTAKKSRSSTIYEAVSDKNGIYAFAKIPSNSYYEITATANGHNFSPKTYRTGRSRDSSSAVGNIWGADVKSSNNAPAYSMNDLLDNQSLTFSQSGAKNWLPASSSFYDNDAAESGYIGNYQQSNIETEVIGPATLSFHWKVSSEENWDKLNLKIDGTTVKTISGEVDWTQEYISIDEGTHTVTWSYEKDNSNASGQDKAWLDKVEMSPGITVNEAVDNDALVFTTDTPITPWLALKDSNFTTDADGLVSSVHHHYGANAIHTSITGPATLTFDWKVSSEENWDLLYMEIDGVQQAVISGEVDWTYQTVSIPAGEHNVGWVYYKDNSGTEGEDTAWVDNIQVILTPQ